MEKILVSIICLTYNHENYIEKAIKGFLMQKTTFKYEILIHDDASTDNTVYIIEKYRKQYPNLFKVIYQKENQYSQKKSPTKILFESSNAKYLAFCEGDDYWIDEYKLQKQINFLEKNPAYYASYHNVFVVNEKNKINYLEQNAYPLYDTHDIEFSREILKFMIGQTASLVCKNFWKELSSNEKKDFLTCRANGDKKIAVILSNRGKIKYFKEIMSAYRRTYTGDSWNARIKNKNLSIFNYNSIIDLAEMTKNIFNKKIDISMYLQNIVISSFLIYLKCPYNKLNREIFYQLYKESKLTCIKFIFIFLKKILLYILKKLNIVKKEWERPIYTTSN